MSDDSSEPARPDPKTELKPDDMPRVLVCVDLARETGAIIPPAKAVARALGAELAFVHVIKAYAYTDSETPVDPVEWEIMRRENKRRMAQIAKEHGDGDETPATHLLVGHAADQICGVMAGTPPGYRGAGSGTWRIRCPYGRDGAPNSGAWRQLAASCAGGRRAKTGVFPNICPTRLFRTVRTHHADCREDCPFGECRSGPGSCCSRAGFHRRRSRRALRTKC